MINHISYAAILYIILLGLPLEGCLKNTNPPFSKPPTTQPTAVEPRHIDNLPSLDGGEDEDTNTKEQKELSKQFSRKHKKNTLNIQQLY